MRAGAFVRFEYRIQPLTHYVISTHQLRHSTYQTVTWRRVNFFHD